MIVWQSGLVKFYDLEVVSMGGGCSVGVWKDGATVTLRFKNTNADGTFPPDDDCYIIANLTTSEPFFVRQMRDGAIVVSNGKDIFYRSNETSYPTSASDWALLEVLT